MVIVLAASEISPAWSRSACSELGTMRLAVLAALFATLYISTNLHAQLYEDPEQSFKLMEFDTVLRGGFNLSMCFVELLTCMETIRPDVICYESYWTVRYESVCSAMNDYPCSDEKGFSDPPDWEWKALYDSVCPWRQWDFTF